MRAIYYDTYGGPDCLHERDISVPKLGEHDVRVRVHAVSLNASDVEFLRGRPLYTRAWGFRRPKFRTLGSDCAGQVCDVGSKVTRVEVGDWVFGDLLERWGALAEFVVAPASRWVRIPEGMTPEVACMLPQAGVVAWQCVKAGGDLAGKRVLVNGAGGGSGTFATQMAKLLGARHITAVDLAAKASAMRRLGADEVVDYTQQDYTATHAQYDLIVDFVGSRSVAENVRVLAKGGHYFLVGGSVPRLLGAVTAGSVRSWFSDRTFRLFIHRPNEADLSEVASLCLQRKVQPELWRTFTLAETGAAFQALSTGKVVGKVVIQL